MSAPVAEELFNLILRIPERGTVFILQIFKVSGGITVCPCKNVVRNSGCRPEIVKTVIIRSDDAVTNAKLKIVEHGFFTAHGKPGIDVLVVRTPEHAPRS